MSKYHIHTTPNSNNGWRDTSCIKLSSMGRWAVFFLLIWCVSSANAQEPPIGYAEFRLHCAVCHGDDGKGEGSISGLLNVDRQALDLTRLSQKNKGRYPYKLVFEIIDGRQNIAAHGERMMPIWGNRYSTEASEQFDPYNAQQVIHGRILELVYFIQGIQPE